MTGGFDPAEAQALAATTKYSAERYWLVPERSVYKLPWAGDQIAPTVAALLRQRGSVAEREIVDWLRPTPWDLCSPFLFGQMGDVVNRLEQARQRQEKVLIYGDYDVDGVTSVAMLFQVLKDYGLETIAHIPLRSEGYGLNAEAIVKSQDNGVALIITVDCGVTSVEEAEVAAACGIDLIITDHHEPGAELPRVVGILNPRVDKAYPFPWLCGVGVAFKLVQALYSRWSPPPSGRAERAYLDLVALGTIADIVPLQGENRVLTLLGLDQMLNSEHVGLRALLKECGLEGKRPSAGQIAFTVAPRINAAGRMDTAKLALNLFMEKNEEEALSIARELSRENAARQTVERRILAEVEAELQATEELPEVIVCSSSDWPHGVIGIVASKLVETYRRPIYLISEEGETAKGSARGGLDEYAVVEELTACAAVLTRYGGHQAAGGFSLPTGEIPAFRALLNSRSGPWQASVGKERIPVSGQLLPEEINLPLARTLEALAPFGKSNPEPVFYTRDLIVRQVRAFGEEQAHLKLMLGMGNLTFPVLAFRRGGEAGLFQNGDVLDIIYTLSVNEYQGREELQLLLRDYQRAGERRVIPRETLEIKEPVTAGTLRLDREQVAALYRRLRVAQGDTELAFRWEVGDIGAEAETEMMKILYELGLLQWQGGANPYELILPKVTHKMDLQNSLRYRCFNKQEV